MSDNIEGATPDRLYFTALTTILRQCVDPAYRNYFHPYVVDSSGRPTEQRFFGKQTGPDPIIVLAHRVEQMAQEIEVSDSDGLPDDFQELCVLYNRWFNIARLLRHEYDFTFPARMRPARSHFPTQEPEFDFFENNRTAQPPAVPYPAPTTASDETLRSRLHHDSRYATGADRSDILDRLKNS